MRALTSAPAVLLGIALFGCGSTSTNQGTAPATTSAAAAAAPGEGTAFDRSNYSRLASDPDSYKGAAVDIVGKVFASVERDAKGTYFQMWADPSNSDWNTVVAVADPALQIAQDDYVRVQGTVKGAYSAQNAFGGDVSAVLVVADSIARSSGLATAPPAEATYGRATFTQSSITITVTKVEFAASETRVFATVTNGSASPFTIYSSSVKAVSGGVQVESTYTPSEYPELASSIDPAARSNGVIVFPKMNPNKALRLTFEGSSENADLGNYGSLTWIFTWSGN